MDNNEKINAAENDTSVEPVIEINDVEASGVPECANAKNASSKQADHHSFFGDLFEYFELFVISACVVIILFSTVVRVCQVDGDSMLSTLHDGETLIVSDLLYQPEREDIIVFHQTGDVYNQLIVKRVIATEGEWIDIKQDNNRLRVTVYDKNQENPKILEEDYAQYVGSLVTLSNYTFPVQIPEGCVFVMGDNRNRSADSRFSTIGFVDERRIVGKVVLRITPFDKFGAVN